jgi:hypothetical protein
VKDDIKCATLMGWDKFDRNEGNFFSLIVIGVCLFVWFGYIDVKCGCVYVSVVCIILLGLSWFG